MMSVYGPYDINNPTVLGLCAIPAVIKVGNTIYPVNINHVANTIANGVNNNMIHEVVFSLFLIAPTPMTDGTIANIIGNDGNLISANEYANGSPNNKINSKTINLTLPVAKFPMSIHNQSSNPAQCNTILKYLSLLDIPTSITVLNPTNFSTLFDLQSKSGKYTLYWVLQVTTYPPLNLVPTMMMKGTNTSVSADTNNNYTCICTASNGAKFEYNAPCSDCNQEYYTCKCT